MYRILYIIIFSPFFCCAQKLRADFSNNYSYKDSLLRYHISHTKVDSALAAKWGVDTFFSIGSLVQRAHYTFDRVDELHLLDRAALISGFFVNNGLPIILTTGTNGDGGNGTHGMDKQTQKFGFLYLSVDNSCTSSYLYPLVDAFNQVTKAYLDKQYGKKWRRAERKWLLKAWRSDVRIAKYRRKHGMSMFTPKF